jgi:hypothetical protein
MGMAPWRIPWGQINLQKAGSVIKFRDVIAGIATTKMARIKYFILEASWGIRRLLNFFPGILCSKSCKRPKGQKKPQILRPRSMENAKIIPAT